MTRHHYSCAIVGMGPAGAGFLFNLNEAQAFAALPGRVLALEQRERLGEGSLGDYQISANSLGQAFLECFDEERFEGWTTALEDSAPLQALRAGAQAAPRLSTASAAVCEVTEQLVAYLQARGELEVQRRCRLESIHLLGDGGFELRWYDHAAATWVSACSSTVVCNLGGRQHPDAAYEALAAAGLDRPAWRLPTFGSDDLLRLPPAALKARLAPLLGGSGELVIIGASHSAFALVDRLTEDLGPLLRRVSLLVRSPLRMFYPSTAAAAAAGYSFDPRADVCPRSGRVHRFGGLRYRAKAVAESVLATGRVDGRPADVVLVPLGGPTHSPDQLAGCLANAAALLACLGYEAQLPPILDAHGHTLALQMQRDGLATDEQGRPLDPQGAPVPGLYAFGLGAGLRPHATLGGEPSFRGRMDGVWLYHFDIGRQVLASLLDHFRDTQEAPKNGAQNPHIQRRRVAMP